MNYDISVFKQMLEDINTNISELRDIKEKIYEFESYCIAKDTAANIRAIKNINDAISDLEMIRDKINRDILIIESEVI